MKKRYLLGILILILILILGILGYGIYYSCTKASPFLSSAYWGTCLVCNCLYAVSSDQVSLIRQGGRPTCLICPKCQRNK